MKFVLCLVFLFCICSLGCFKKPRTGRDIFFDTNCIQCHGIDFKGTPLGPPLTDLKKNWTVGALTRYFSDPKAYIQQDERLRKQQKQFTLAMPLPKLDEQDRFILAKFLLKRKP